MEPPTPITINANTRLSTLLDFNPDIVSYIVALNPHDFIRLHNPLMRRFMAPRITLARVAAMAGVSLDTMLADIASLTGAMVIPAPTPVVLAEAPTERPAWLEHALDSVIEINLLALDDALTADPLLPIMQALKASQPGDILWIRHRWEPQPLYDLWAKMATIQWFSEQIAPDEWWVWVWHKHAARDDKELIMDSPEVGVWAFLLHCVARQSGAWDWHNQRADCLCH